MGRGHGPSSLCPPGRQGPSAAGLFALDPGALWEISWGSSLEPSPPTDGWGRQERKGSLVSERPGLRPCSVGVPAAPVSPVHLRPPVSNLVGKRLFLGPRNLAMGSHDQWQLQAEYTIGSWLLAGGVGQTAGE